MAAQEFNAKDMWIVFFGSWNLRVRPLMKALGFRDEKQHESILQAVAVQRAKSAHLAARFEAPTLNPKHTYKCTLQDHKRSTSITISCMIIGQHILQNLRAHGIYFLRKMVLVHRACKFIWASGRYRPECISYISPAWAGRFTTIAKTPPCMIEHADTLKKGRGPGPGNGLQGPSRSIRVQKGFRLKFPVNSGFRV